MHLGSEQGVRMIGMTCGSPHFIYFE